LFISNGQNIRKHQQAGGLLLSSVGKNDNKLGACRLLIAPQKKSLIKTQKKSKYNELVHHHLL